MGVAADAAGDSYFMNCQCVCFGCHGCQRVQLIKAMGHNHDPVLECCTGTFCLCCSVQQLVLEIQMIVSQPEILVTPSQQFIVVRNGAHPYSNHVGPNVIGHRVEYSNYPENHSPANHPFATE